MASDSTMSGLNLKTNRDGGEKMEKSQFKGSSGFKPISSSVVIEWGRKGHDFRRSRGGNL
jgi:hypothetical protein